MNSMKQPETPNFARRRAVALAGALLAAGTVSQIPVVHQGEAATIRVTVNTAGNTWNHLPGMGPEYSQEQLDQFATHTITLQPNMGPKEAVRVVDPLMPLDSDAMAQISQIVEEQGTEAGNSVKIPVIPQYQQPDQPKH